MAERSKPDSPVTIAWRSDRGRVRKENEDSAFGGPVPGVEGWSLLAVADGLGGHRNGAWASRTALDEVVSSLAVGVNDPAVALERAIQRANATINARGAEDAAYDGAATTIVATLVSGTRAWWANVGDSRLYLLRDGALTPISRDHSLVAEQVRAGLLSPEDARTAPGRNVITRSVGFEPAVEVDTGGPLDLSDRDVLVLCSDGLYGPVAEDEIASIVGRLDPDEATEALVAAANRAGGPDNITVVLAAFQPG